MLVINGGINNNLTFLSFILFYLFKSPCLYTYRQRRKKKQAVGMIIPISWGTRFFTR
jgi:hypothetical protein